MNSNRVRDICAQLAGVGLLLILGVSPSLPQHNGCSGGSAPATCNKFKSKENSADYTNQTNQEDAGDKYRSILIQEDKEHTKCVNKCWEKYPNEAQAQQRGRCINQCDADYNGDVRDGYESGRYKIDRAKADYEHKVTGLCDSNNPCDCNPPGPCSEWDENCPDPMAMTYVVLSEPTYK